MKNILLDIILWIAILLSIVDVIGICLLIYGTIIKNSICCGIGTNVIITVPIIYTIMIIPDYLISRFMND